MILKLPSIHVLTNPDKKSSDSLPSKFVHVRNGHAFVVHNLIAVVNLREYFKTECEVEDESDIEEMDNILEWLEGKSFTKQAWSELVKLRDISVGDNCLDIEEVNYKNKLFYDVSVDHDVSLHSIKSNINRPEEGVIRISIQGRDLDLLNKAFKNELKSDLLNLEFSGQGAPIKFALEHRSFIFGSFSGLSDASLNLLAFVQNLDFKEYVDTIEIKDPNDWTDEDFDSEQEEELEQVPEPFPDVEFK